MVGGAALRTASRDLRKKILRRASKMLEAAVRDLDIADARVHVKGAPTKCVTLQEIAYAAYRQGDAPARGASNPVLEGRGTFEPPAQVWSYGCSAALVSVDRMTGKTSVLEYQVVHDCGTVINPAIVDGQIHGGALQGIGGALLEELIYDDSGQLLTGTYMDYLLPTAIEAPEFDIEHMETPSPHIPGGAKGTGEAGAIGAAAAIASAIEDALKDLGVTIATMPATPSRIRDLIRRANGGDA